MSDERRIAKNKEISEYGRVWTSRDTHLANESVYARLASMDDSPNANDKSLMRSMIIASPESLKINRVLMNKKFHQGKAKQLKEILSKIVVSVQKNTTQLVCAFCLDCCPHAVLGRKGGNTSARSFGAEMVVFDNTMDHPFDSTYPDQPIVCNTDDVAGITNLHLIVAVGMPVEIIGWSLKQQVKECIKNGLRKHAMEYIEIAQFDTRGTMSFHAGVSPREATEWKRKNGCGIAVPGLRKNSMRASPSFLKWLLHLKILISHCFLERFLEGTIRERQALPTKFRVQLLEDWRSYLGCPAEYASELRIGGGLSLNSGAVCFHLDHLNDPRENYDQILWGSICVKSWGN